MTNNQDATPSVATPVIYEGLEFPELPYVSRWVEVDGIRIHYIEGGNPCADPILFLHGIPTWSYIWRNVMPVVEPNGRVIALDFVGFGRSERPDVPYNLAAQATYLEGFIDALNLHDITLVVHDLGSGVGFAYAAAHEDHIKGIAFMEAAIPPVFSSDFVPTGATAEFMATVQTILQSGAGEEIVLNQNAFIEQVLPAQIVRSLTEAEMNAYRVPFPTPESRRPILDNGPRQFPDSAFDMVGSYTEWLTTTDVPMLHLYATPGMVNPEVSVQWSRTHIHTIEQQDLGAGRHYLQEDHAVEIGVAIRDWLGRVVNAN